MDLKEIGREGVKWTDVAKDRQVKLCYDCCIFGLHKTRGMS